MSLSISSGGEGDTQKFTGIQLKQTKMQKICEATGTFDSGDRSGSLSEADQVNSLLENTDDDMKTKRKLVKKPSRFQLRIETHKAYQYSIKGLNSSTTKRTASPMRRTASKTRDQMNPNKPSSLVSSAQPSYRNLYGQGVSQPKKFKMMTMATIDPKDRCPSPVKIPSPSRINTRFSMDVGMMQKVSERFRNSVINQY